MTEESATMSDLSTAVTTQQDDKTQTTNGGGMTSQSSDLEFYFACAVVVIGVVGTAGNAVVLYALVASKQHKKLVLIVNQNALDLFSSFFLVICYVVKLCNVYLTGAVGHWLCLTLVGESLIWLGTNGSIINLASITIERYLKVAHPIWSRKKMSPWMIYSAMAFSWLVGIVYNITVAFETSRVVDGVCYSYAFFRGSVDIWANNIWYVSFFYVNIIAIFVFCYGSILVAIRRQASVMADHGSAGTSTAPPQMTQIQTNVIKTMILVCAFYAATRLPANVYVILKLVDPSSTLVDGRFYASVFIAFLYTTMNPFIYATKFDPVKQVLRGIIPCKKTSVEPTDGPGSAGTTGTRKHLGNERF